MIKNMYCKMNSLMNNQINIKFAFLQSEHDQNRIKKAMIIPTIYSMRP